MIASARNRRSADPRRGFRVLVGAGVVFAVVNFVGGLLLDYRWPELRFPEKAEVFARLAAFGGSPDVVAMGSSRTFGAFAPEVIDPLMRDFTRQAPRTFNAAMNAGDVIVAERLFAGMLDAGHRPSVLVIEVSPEFLSRRSSLLSQQVLRQMTWTDLPSYLPDAALYTPIMRLVSCRLSPIFTHRYQIRKRLFGPAPADVVSAIQPASDGPRPTPNLNDLPPPLSIASGPPVVGPPAKMVVESLRGDYRLSPIATAALERLLARCREAGVQVVLVGAPSMTCNRALYKPDIDSVYFGFVHSLEARYGCRFVDFRDRVPDDQFGEALHVNGVGRQCFSYALAREVLIPLWRELHP